MLAQVYIALWIAFVIYIYRWNQRRLSKDADAPSWLPPNQAKDKYLELVDKYGDEIDTNDSYKQECKQALIQRAVIDLQHAQQLTREKSSLQHLIKEGAIGEDVWNRIQRAEEELNLELNDVINEAETFELGWGSRIMQDASQALHRQVQIQAQLQQQEAANAQNEMKKSAAPSQPTAAEMAKRERDAEKAMKELLAQEEAEKRRRDKQAGKKKK